MLMYHILSSHIEYLIVGISYLEKEDVRVLLRQVSADNSFGIAKLEIHYNLFCGNSSICSRFQGQTNVQNSKTIVLIPSVST